MSETNCLILVQVKADIIKLAFSWHLHILKVQAATQVSVWHYPTQRTTLRLVMFKVLLFLSRS